jgi:hypothetical protein
MTALCTAVLLAAGVAGCGGSESGVPCDDAGFRSQAEELYVAIATAQNAQARGAPDLVVADLRRGADVLAAYLDAHPPCDDALKELEAQEREAIAALESVLPALGRGEDVSGEIAAAVAALGAVEEALR